MHSALVPPGALHQRVTAALASWRLDDAEELLGQTGSDPSPYVPVDRRGAVEGAVQGGSARDTAGGSLGRAWSDTLRAELLVRRLRVAGFTLLGDRLDAVDGAGTPEALDPAHPAPATNGGGEPLAAHVAQALALVRSAKAAFETTDDDLQRAAGLARHARIELLSRRVDAAMDEAVEAASLLDPGLPPGRLLVDTLTTLAGVLADLDLMPLALDYQRRAHATALVAAADPGVLGPADGDPAELVATAAVRLGELDAELGEALLGDGDGASAGPHFAQAGELAEQALATLRPHHPAVVGAPVVRGWALVGLGEYPAATVVLSSAVRAVDSGNGPILGSAELALGRGLRRQGNEREADEHLTRALAVGTEQSLIRLRRAALRELCTLHSGRDDADRALPYLQSYIAEELDRVDERRTRWVELFGRRKSLLETERAAGQLRREAYEDPLTHLPNRRYAEARLDGLLSSGSAPALAVVDVDRFKSINDAVGHPGGDAVLRAVAELLVAGVRDSDEVCRWAGDEFVILLPDTTAEQAERALERIRRAVATYHWASLGLAATVTISAGIASAARGDDRRTLFAAADGVLYDAKRGGRDRVVRLSTLTQTRAPADLPEGPDQGPASAPETRLEPALQTEPQAESMPPIEPAPALARAFPSGAAVGFAPLLAEPPPPLGLGSSAEPLLGPVPAPATAPVRGPAGPPVVEPAVVWASGRSAAQVLALVREARQEQQSSPVLVLRADADILVALAAEHAGVTTIDAGARAAAVGPLPVPAGRIAVLCANGGDLTVAAEAAFVARVSGCAGLRFDDVAPHRLPALLSEVALRDDVDCLVVVAGLDPAPAEVATAALDVPVVAVPTSAGQSTAFGGLAPLLAMLAAAPGLAVSPVDNGHSAGLFAARVARGAARRAAR